MFVPLRISSTGLHNAILDDGTTWQGDFACIGVASLECSVTSKGGATPLQAKWIKLDLVLRKFFAAQAETDLMLMLCTDHHQEFMH